MGLKKTYSLIIQVLRIIRITLLLIPNLRNAQLQPHKNLPPKGSRHIKSETSTQRRSTSTERIKLSKQLTLFLKSFRIGLKVKWKTIPYLKFLRSY